MNLRKKKTNCKNISLEVIRTNTAKKQKCLIIINTISYQKYFRLLHANFSRLYNLLRPFDNPPVILQET